MEQVTAKFKVDSITTTIQKQQIVPGNDWSQENMRDVEMKTMNMTPVYSQDPNSENAKFWAATPCGQIQLGVVNPGASAMFHPGKEYFVTFAPATAL